ncbi:hypothetical protein CGBL_0127280 [Corynebacterium glutamicum]|nr:hypothetical protein CGBL_0127280 [Corynebacterium glutamicum]
MITSCPASQKPLESAACTYKPTSPITSSTATSPIPAPHLTARPATQPPR